MSESLLMRYCKEIVGNAVDDLYYNGRRHAKSVKIAQAHFSTPKISTKKRVNPPILKFATKQRNLLITPSQTM